MSDTRISGKVTMYAPTRMPRWMSWLIAAVCFRGSGARGECALYLVRVDDLLRAKEAGVVSDE